MGKEGTIYQDQTLEGLLNLWVESKQAGCDDLCGQIWDELLFKDRQQTKIELEKLRKELEVIIGC